MRRSKPAESNTGCSTSVPPAAKVAATVCTKLPAQNKPLAVTVRTSSPSARKRGQRHSWIATAWWGLSTPLGRPVLPEENMSTAGSARVTEAATASTSAGDIA
jgi:hypothetical protein